MARTVTEIQNSIIQNVQNNPVLNTQLTSTSQTAIWRLQVYIVAVAIWTLEKLFDTHKTEVESILAAKSPHRPTWYVLKAKYFQYGYSLYGNTDTYETIDTDAQIVAFSAASEGGDGYLKLKIAKQGSTALDYLSGSFPNNSVSAPITETSGGSGEKLAFYTFMERVKDVGVKIRYVSQEADHLRLVIDLYYDPLVLNELGERIDGTSNSPIQDAIKIYIESLPFNGEFTIMALTDALQAIDGVKIPQILSVESYWGAFAWSVISAKYKPESGYMKVYDENTDLTINYKAYEEDL